MATALSSEDRLRATASGVLMSWIAFAAAGFGFYKTTEDPSVLEGGDAHLALGGAHVAVQILAIIASIADPCRALPLVVTALRQARRARAVGRATGWRSGAWRSSGRHHGPSGVRALGAVHFTHRGGVAFGLGYW